METRQQMSDLRITHQCPSSQSVSALPASLQTHEGRPAPSASLTVHEGRAAPPASYPPLEGHEPLLPHSLNKYHYYRLTLPIMLLIRELLTTPHLLN